MKETQKQDLRRIAREALAATGVFAGVADECKTPPEECRSEKGPGGCRVHCAEYFDRLCETVSFDKARQGLKEKYGIECIQ